MSSEVIGAVCGGCLAHISASHVPTACFSCGSRYDRAPYALVLLDIAATTRPGAVEVSPRFTVVFYGAWDIESRAAINDAFGG